jgi:hypothetical protein
VDHEARQQNDDDDHQQVREIFDHRHEHVLDRDKSARDERNRHLTGPLEKHEDYVEERQQQEGLGRSAQPLVRAVQQPGYILLGENSLALDTQAVEPGSAPLVDLAIEVARYTPDEHPQGAEYQPRDADQQQLGNCLRQYGSAKPAGQHRLEFCQ